MGVVDLAWDPRDRSIAHRCRGPRCHAAVAKPGWHAAGDHEEKAAVSPAALLPAGSSGTRVPLQEALSRITSKTHRSPRGCRDACGDPAERLV
jgi:hypothetical protein